MLTRTDDICTRDIKSRETFNFDGTKITGDIGAYAVVNCREPVIISGNVGANATINCSKGVTFSGDIGAYAKINCSSTPIFTGRVGRYVKVNGSYYSSPSASVGAGGVSVVSVVGALPDEYKGGLSVVGVSGDFIVEAGASGSVHVSAGIPIVSRGLSSSHFSTASISQSMAFPVASARHESALKLNAYSKTTQAYVDSFERKPKNLDILNELKLSPQEEKEFEGCYDSITTEIMNIPVRLNDHLYDIQTLLKLSEIADLRIDPFNKDEFYLRDIQPARDIQAKFEEKISLIRTQRALAARSADASSLSQHSPPGGAKL